MVIESLCLVIYTSSNNNSFYFLRFVHLSSPSHYNMLFSLLGILSLASSSKSKSFSRHQLNETFIESLYWSYQMWFTYSSCELQNTSQGQLYFSYKRICHIISVKLHIQLTPLVSKLLNTKESVNLIHK